MTMLRTKLPPVEAWAARYAVAAVAVGCATGYVTLLAALTSVTPFILFAAAVAVTTVRGGYGPAALAVVLAGLVSDFLFIEPRHELTLGRGTAYLSTLYGVATVAGPLRVYYGGLGKRTRENDIPRYERNGQP